MADTFQKPAQPAQVAEPPAPAYNASDELVLDDAALQILQNRADKMEPWVVMSF